MNKFTAGPWDIVKTRQGAFTTIMSKTNAHIAEMVKWYTTDPELIAEMEANAKLVAAAPDLLEALQELLASYESMMHNEFDFPNDPWSAEGRNDDEALNAKKTIAKALA